MAVALPLATLTGCVVTQPQDTPIPELTGVELRTGRHYALYVPSAYSAERDWPLVITLHGTFGFDGYRDQVREWKSLAEKHGFLVAAPELRSTQGILPRIGEWWYDDLKSDEQAILALLDELEKRYRINTKCVLLSGFSSGAFPMYWTGLRAPTRFGMLVARQGNCDLDMLERAGPAAEAGKLLVGIVYGTADLPPLSNQAFAAQRFLSQHGVPTVMRAVDGGHFRHPEAAWELWRDRLRRLAAAQASSRSEGGGLAERAARAPAGVGPMATVRPRPRPVVASSRPAGRSEREAGDAPSSKRRHVVRPGETYWSLAERYLGSGRRWREIAECNPTVEGSRLRVGQEIVIPQADR